MSAVTSVRAGEVSATAVEALTGLFDVPADTVLGGGLLPPLWHWAQLPELPTQSDLGPDGHPRSGIPSPPSPGMRRMFAGGRTTHLHQLVVGRPARRVSTVIDRAEKRGRSGPLVFVTVRHSLEQEGRVAIIDDQDIVYRPMSTSGIEAGSAAPAPIRPPDDRPVDEAGLSLFVDPVLLFRFSALTYNAHRIHYDLRHCEAEGYPDLVIHGPLQVLVMAEFLRRRGEDLRGRRFEYRLLAPALGSQWLTVRPEEEPGRGASGHTLVVEGSSSGVVARAHLEERT